MGESGGLVFPMAVYLQSGLGFSPLGSGLVFTAYAGGFAFANLDWARLPGRLLRWTPTAALAALVVADALLGAIIVRTLAAGAHAAAAGRRGHQPRRHLGPCQPPRDPDRAGLRAGPERPGHHRDAALDRGRDRDPGHDLPGHGRSGPAAPGYAIALVAFTVAVAAAVAAACSVQLAAARRT